MKPLLERATDWRAARRRQAAIRVLYENFYGLVDLLEYLRLVADAGVQIPEMLEPMKRFYNETYAQIDRLEQSGRITVSELEAAKKINLAVRLAYRGRIDADRAAAVRLGREPPEKQSFDEVYRPPGGWKEFSEQHWQRLLDAKRSARN